LFTGPLYSRKGECPLKHISTCG